MTIAIPLSPAFDTPNMKAAINASIKLVVESSNINFIWVLSCQK
jgi:hypothetical protein